MAEVKTKATDLSVDVYIDAAHELGQRPTIFATLLINNRVDVRVNA